MEQGSKAAAVVWPVRGPKAETGIQDLRLPAQGTRLWHLRTHKQTRLIVRKQGSVLLRHRPEKLLTKRSGKDTYPGF